jgi:hypothetical protein
MNDLFSILDPLFDGVIGYGAVGPLLSNATN